MPLQNHVYRIPFTLERTLFLDAPMVLEIINNFAGYPDDTPPSIIDPLSDVQVRNVIIAQLRRLTGFHIDLRTGKLSLGEITYRVTEGSDKPRYAIAGTNDWNKVVWWCEEQKQWMPMVDEFEKNHPAVPRTLVRTDVVTVAEDKVLFISDDVAYGIAERLKVDWEGVIKDIKVVTPVYYRQTQRISFAETIESLEPPADKE